MDSPAEELLRAHAEIARLQAIVARQNLLIGSFLEHGTRPAAATTTWELLTAENLTATQADVLQALHEGGHTTASNRLAADLIADKAGCGSRVLEAAIKELCCGLSLPNSEMRSPPLINTKQGRGGGSFLTDFGCSTFAAYEQKKLRTNSTSKTTEFARTSLRCVS